MASAKQRLAGFAAFFVCAAVLVLAVLATRRVAPLGCCAAARGAEAPAFCGLAALDYGGFDPSLARCIVARAPALGKRTHLPLARKGRSLDARACMRHFPQLRAEYARAAAFASAVTGVALRADFDEGRSPLACCVLVYEDDGDFIAWHHDANQYAGRAFTVLLPLTSDPPHVQGCARFEYRDPCSGALGSVGARPGTALVFEGDRVHHRCTRHRAACGARVVVSFHLTSEARVRSVLTDRIKRLAF